MKILTITDKFKRIWWIILSVVWFCASSFGRGTVFCESELIGSNSLIQKDYEKYNSLQMFLTYAMIKVVGIFLIMFLCNCLNKLIKKSYGCYQIVIFFVLFAFLVLYALALYPSSYAIEPDSYTILAFARRNQPYYWHGIFTVLLYGGSMVVFPSPLTLPIIQVFVFSYVFAYGSKVMSNLTRKWWSLFLIMLLPETFYIAFEPYRNCFCAILSMYSVLFIIDYMNSREAVSYSKQIVMAILFALLSVWRTEGIFLGFILFIILVSVDFRRQIKKKLILGFSYLSCFLLISSFQSIGAKNYYGRDYLLVSTMNPARAILRDGKNLAYQGVEEDKAVLNEVCPQIQTEGVLGFRNKNESEGRNIHQSMADESVQKAYLSAYARLLKNNISTYIKYQINVSFEALGSSAIYPLTWNYGQGSGVYESYMLEYNTYGEELNRTRFALTWSNSMMRSKLLSAYDKIFGTIRVYIDATFVPIALHFAVPVLLLYELICLICGWIKNKRFEYCILIICALFAQFGAIVLTMPESREAYFYSVLFGMYTVLIYLRTKKQ